MYRLYIWIRFFFVCLLLVATQIINAKGLPVEDSITFPSINDFQIEYNYPVYYSDNLWDLIDGAADAFVSYGFVDLHIAEYVKNDLHVKVEIYQHKTAILAFGMYAAERSPGYKFVSLGVQGYSENSLVYFVKGPYYVKVTTYQDDEKTGVLLMNIAKAIELNLSGSNLLPKAFGKFPVPGQLKNSAHYIPGNFIGYSFLSEAYTIEYASGDNTFTAFLIQNTLKPNVVEMVKKLKQNAIHSKELSNGIIRVEDKYNGNLFLLLNGDHLMGTLGKADQGAMVGFLTEFNRSFK